MNQRRTSATCGCQHQCGIVLLLLLLVGCGTSSQAATATARAGVGSASASPSARRASPGTPVKSGTPTTGPISAQVADPALLAQLRGLESLHIVDQWWVYGPIQIKEMTFFLRRDGANFTGIGNYAATSYYGPQTKTSRQITIPEAVIFDFLALLAAAPLRDGHYKPDNGASDYYPKLLIDVTFPTGNAAYYSESQPQGNVPWGATIAGHDYTINSAHPYDALTMLEPYLQREMMLRSLEATIEATRRATPTATPLTPVLCRTPVAGKPTPTSIVVPSPDPLAPRVAPGAQPHIGEVINLAQYFGLTGSTFLAAGGNFAPFSLSGKERVAPIIAALDREGSVRARPSDNSPEDFILITIDVAGKPVSFSYSAQQGLITFSVTGQSYATPAPPAFHDLWVQLICSRPQ